MIVVYRNAFAFRKSRFYWLSVKLNFIKVQFCTTLIERITLFGLTIIVIITEGEVK